MAKISISPQAPEDYLLGQLSPAARRQFEAQLEQSAELRAQVRELEEGLVALAMTAPRHAAPRAAWQNIETAIARPVRWNLWASLAWLKFKWVATGAGVTVTLTAALLLHTFWRHPATSSTALGLNNALANSQRDTSVKYSSTTAIAHAEANSPSTAAHNSMAAKGQAGDWQQKITQPEDQPSGHVRPQFVVTEESGSQSTTQVECTVSNKAKLPRIAQQTMLLAASGNRSQGGKASVSEANDAGQDQGQQEDQVDVVVLTASTDTLWIGPPSVGNPSPFSPAGVMPTSDWTQPILFGGDTPNNMPTPSSSPYVIAVVDPNVLPADMNPITVWEMYPDLGSFPIPLGTVHLGTHPTLIEVSGSGVLAGQYYFITAGASNTVISQFPPQ